MGWNGSGTFSQTDGTYSGDGICASQAGDGDATIKSTELDALFEDHNDGINACLTKNGENAASANLDLGGFLFQNSGAPSADTDLAVHGDVIASGTYNAGADELRFVQNDGTRVDVDVSSLSAGTGGMDLSTAQTAAGIKTFSAIGSHAHVKFNGPTTSKVLVPTPGANVTIDTTAGNAHYVTVGTNTDVTFTWPTAASDTQLGANWSVHGYILFRTTSAGKTVTLNSTMLAALDVYEEEGAEATGSDDLSTLVYNFMYIGGTKIAQFAWVSTP